MGQRIIPRERDPRELHKALQMVDAHNAFGKAHYRVTRDRSVRERLRRWLRRMKRTTALRLSLGLEP